MIKTKKRSGIEEKLSRLAIRDERFMQVTLNELMAFISKQIRKDLKNKYQKSFASELTDWEVIESQGEKIIKPATIKIMQSGGNAAYKSLAISGSFDVLNVPAIRAVEKFGAKLVKDITTGTRDGINTYIKHGIKEGYSMPKIARDLRPLVGLTGRQTQSIVNYRRLLTEKRPDLKPAQIDRAVMKYTSKTYRQRMETIARTETARAQNIGYVQGLEQVGIKEAQFQISPSACEECIALNETIYPIKEAAGIIPVHPRCRCAMLPVIDDKVISDYLKQPHPKL